MPLCMSCPIRPNIRTNKIKIIKTNPSAYNITPKIENNFPVDIVEQTVARFICLFAIVEINIFDESSFPKEVV